MTENEEYTIHNDYDKINRAINELAEVDEETTKNSTELFRKSKLSTLNSSPQ